MFISRCQRPGEKAADFANHLRKLFKQAYPDEDVTSGILLQWFLIGLAPPVPVSQQILLCERPTTFKEAVESAEAVEYALNFETKPTEPVTKDINMIKPHSMEDPKLVSQVQLALEQMTKHLEALEARLQPADVRQTVRDRNPSRNRRRNNCARYAFIADHDCRTCWEGGEFGHFQRDCPQLNYDGPARSMDGWPRK